MARKPSDVIATAAPTRARCLPSGPTRTRATEGASRTTMPLTALEKTSRVSSSRLGKRWAGGRPQPTIASTAESPTWPP